MTLHVGSPFIRWFASIGLADQPTVGGKGASLGELDRTGVRVPPGFVVTTAAFDRMLATLDVNGAMRARIARLDPKDVPGVRNACADIRQRIESTPLPTELNAVLGEAYRELSDREHNIAVAVRSSVTSGDSADASLAGLQETYLGVRGAEGLAHCVRSCWASLYGVESVTHRRQRQLPEQNVALAVIAQRMVSAHCSGVMFTRNPASGDRSVITIEGSWGLGSAVVSGEVTPDKFVVSKVTGEVHTRAVADKVTQHLPDAIAGGVRREPVPDELRSVQCLTDAQIAELVQTAKRVERHYGCAQDIEWAIVPGERGVYVLQSRPEIVLSNLDNSPATAPKTHAFRGVVSLSSGRQR